MVSSFKGFRLIREFTVGSHARIQHVASILDGRPISDGAHHLPEWFLDIFSSLPLLSRKIFVYIYMRGKGSRLNDTRDDHDRTVLFQQFCNYDRAIKSHFFLLGILEVVATSKNARRERAKERRWYRPTWVCEARKCCAKNTRSSVRKRERERKRDVTDHGANTRARTKTGGYTGVLHRTSVTMSKLLLLVSCSRLTRQLISD